MSSQDWRIWTYMTIVLTSWLAATNTPLFLKKNTKKVSALIPEYLHEIYPGRPKIGGWSSGPSTTPAEHYVFWSLSDKTIPMRIRSSAVCDTVRVTWLNAVAQIIMFHTVFHCQFETIATWTFQQSSHRWRTPAGAWQTVSVSFVPEMVSWLTTWTHTHTHTRVLV